MIALRVGGGHSLPNYSYKKQRCVLLYIVSTSLNVVPASRMSGAVPLLHTCRHGVLLVEHRDCFTSFLLRVQHRMSKSKEETNLARLGATRTHGPVCLVLCRSGTTQVCLSKLALHAVNPLSPAVTLRTARLLKNGCRWGVGGGLQRIGKIAGRNVVAPPPAQHKLCRPWLLVK